MLRAFFYTLLLLAAGAGRARAQDPVPAHPEVVASASASQPVRADLAVLTVRFSRSGTTPADAGRSVALKADSVRRALRPLGIAPDSVINTSRWYWWNNRVERVETQRVIRRSVVRDGTPYGEDTTVVDTSYRASESLQIRVRDLERVGAVVDAVLAQGISEIGSVEFSATSTEREQRGAFHEATQRARARAETLAAAGGGRLGRTLRLSTDAEVARSRFDAYGGVGNLVVTEGVASGAGNTVVVRPVLRVTATVYGRWELVESP